MSQDDTPFNWLLYEDVSETFVMFFMLLGCAAIHAVCVETEGRLHARLRAHQRHGANGGEERLEVRISEALSRRKASAERKGLSTVVAGAVKEHAIALLRWLMTRSVDHYGKMEWRNIVYLLGKEGNTNGLYLISKCIQNEGCYELAVCHNGTVHRYLIRRFRNNTFGIHESSQFSDLYGVILHYRQRANGLCFKLERNAWRKDGEEIIRRRDMELLQDE